MSKYVQNFQKEHNLTPDGVIGSKTLSKMMELWGLNKIELAHLLGQMAHESGGLTIGYENLNYSEKGLLQTFPKYFNSTTAKSYARNPEKIANRAYANRMGNGNEASGDGWKYRGRGGLQLTGKDNYVAFSKFIGEDVVNNPDLVAEKYFFETAVFYFQRNKLFKHCTSVNNTIITKISKGVNLGNIDSRSTPHGLQDRINKTLFYYNKIK